MQEQSQVSAGALCNSRHSFVSAALSQGVRLDGRRLADFRGVQIFYRSDCFGQVEVSVGKTRVLCVVSSKVVKPLRGRGNEGVLVFAVDIPGRQAEDVSGLLDRLLRTSKAVDLEALCIRAGAQVWSVRVDVRQLADDGNLCDAACLAAISALAHFKLQDVSYIGNSITLHSKEEREPVPLCIHHMPVNISVGYVGGSDSVILVDPTKAEEAAIAGKMCVAVNQFGEICGLHKIGGAGLSRSCVQQTSLTVVEAAQDILRKVKRSLEIDRQSRASWKRNIHYAYGGELPLDITPLYLKRRKQRHDSSLKALLPSPAEAEGGHIREGWRARMEARGKARTAAEAVGGSGNDGPFNAGTDKQEESTERKEGRSSQAPDSEG